VSEITLRGFDKLPPLNEWLDYQTHLCTHVLIIRNGKEPSIESVTHISQDQIKIMRDIWLVQYYNEQSRRAAIAAERKQEGRLRRYPKRPLAKEAVAGSDTE